MEVPSADDAVLAAVDGRRTAVLAWDWEQREQPTSNGVYFGKPVPATAARTVQLDLRHLAPGNYRLQVRRTGYKANDAHTAYLEMGSPKDLAPAQLQALQQLTTDKPELDRTLRVRADGRARWTLPMRSNDVVLVTIEPVAK